MKRMNVLALLIVGLVLALGAPMAGAKPHTKPHFWLTVLHNNDGESRLIAAGGGELADYGGVARFKTVVDNLKKEATTGPLARQYPGKRGVVMISSGDNFLAGPQFNASLEKGVPFYDSIAMNLIGYDAAAIGNHEFDFGPDVLADFIEGTHGFPWLSANLDFSAEPRLQALLDAGRIAPSTVIKERGERIGVVGAITPLLPAISSPRNTIVDPNVAAAVQREIDRLEAQGVNKIILTSHLQNVQEDLALIPMLRGVDVAIAGGGDELLANPGTLLVPGDTIQGPYPILVQNADGATVPVVTTAGDYKYVGKLVVGFNKAGEVIVTDGAASGPVRVSGVGPDAVQPHPTVQRLVVDPVVEYVADLAATVVGTSQVPLEGRRPPIRQEETNLGNLMADALRWQANQVAAGFGVPQADIGLQNGGGIRNNSLIPAGPITLLNTFEIAAFSNWVSIAPGIPTDQLKELLENSVSRQPLEDGRWGHWSGLSFTYSLSGTAQVVDNDGNVLTPGMRIRDAALDDGTVLITNGVPVPGVTVNIASNDFTIQGGDQYPFRGAEFTRLGVTYQQALANYIRNGLGGVISAAQYPVGGEGRITQLP